MNYRYNEMHIYKIKAIIFVINFMSNPYVNYGYLLYPNQQINMNYPSLT